MMENILNSLFEAHWGHCPDRLEALPLSGSSRKYYRIFDGTDSFIGVCHSSWEENRLFIDFSRHFRAQGLNVPQVFVVSADGLAYIQEDLGGCMLLDVVESGRRDVALNPEVLELYRKSLDELLRIQFLGNEGLDYSHCIPRPVFDRRCIIWDLNYFKYCFLKLAGASFSEDLLENDFELLLEQVCNVSADTFMFRDFQSRNIMVKDGKVWFIDYQGGRQGALHYDVASLLYDAIVAIPDIQREELLDYYIGELQRWRPVDAEVFRKDYYRFVLIRLLQAMGAFGLRGLYERKQHFIDSIQPGLKGIHGLFESGRLGDDYPEIRRIVSNMLLREA